MTLADHDRRQALRGRELECARLERMLVAAGENRSQVLVLRGEAGVGKSALLDHVVAAADGCQIARTAGVESEMELPFAALHQLCLPMRAAWALFLPLSETP